MRRAWLLGAAVLGGCEGLQSSASPAGPQAFRIHELGTFFIAVLSLIYLGVLVALVLALVRARRAGDGVEAPEVDPHTLPDLPARPVTGVDEAGERTFKRVITFFASLTAACLFVFLLTSFVTGKRIAELSAKPARVVRVIGHQWWWELRYEDADPSKLVITANELHLPVGEPVRLSLESADVIHSFWVPALHGKRDLIPGWSSTTTVQVDRPGEYRGQCAEFCGYQHANMGLLVIAEPKDAFEAWLAAQKQDARAPTTAAQQEGQKAFLEGPCSMCHAIRGTNAGGAVAPDLTHVASRKYLAATTLPNSPGNLGGWIANSQGIKPGNHMPAVGLQGDQLQALVEYLGSLQ